MRQSIGTLTPATTLTCTPSASRCATLQGVAPKTSVKISTSGCGKPLEHLAGLGLDLLDRHVGQHVERAELRRAVGKGVLGHGLQRRRERRVGDDQKSGHGGGLWRVDGQATQRQADRAEERFERLGPTGSLGAEHVAW